MQNVYVRIKMGSVKSMDGVSWRCCATTIHMWLSLFCVLKNRALFLMRQGLKVAALVCRYRLLEFGADHLWSFYKLRCKALSYRDFVCTFSTSLSAASDTFWGSQPSTRWFCFASIEFQNFAQWTMSFWGKTKNFCFSSTGKTWKWRSLAGEWVS